MASKLLKEQPRVRELGGRSTWGVHRADCVRSAGCQGSQLVLAKHLQDLLCQLAAVAVVVVVV
eukprot:CAMPEP_0115129682 /NCGR_PEP_ID=MMETSP0227-20121206/51944_1 /TAXON_ID=89957 /ORGANISM="Polarella glacialis, Strain CCMP 1383" /LENGTH=62 /DNA_ID=CAMNT_0002534613 /DNA_START=111 /DNA_END=295 /DNA_ORIENTATION=-